MNSRAELHSSEGEGWLRIREMRHNCMHTAVLLRLSEK